MLGCEGCRLGAARVLDVLDARVCVISVRAGLLTSQLAAVNGHWAGGSWWELPVPVRNQKQASMCAQKKIAKTVKTMPR